jgi:hypothetical protein
MVSLAFLSSNSRTATLSSVPAPSSEYLVKSKLSRVIWLSDRAKINLNEL